MTPIFLNSSSNTYWPTDLHHQDHDHFSNNNQEFLSPNNSQASSSSNSLITHMFLNSTVHDENGISDRELQPPQHQQHEDYNFGSQVYKDDRIENKDDKGHEFPTWNKSTEMNNMINNDQNQVKWMSSKMRVMLKMKKSDHPVNPNAYRSTTREVMMLEDHKLPNSPTDQETDNSSNTTTSNSSVPIRVCSDCNTTKTPLWRSGPRGPKSLCNACGIRQRKARRALAIAAAENGNCSVSIDHQSMIMVPLKVTKTPHKHHKKPSNNNGHHVITKYKKKRQYTKQIITIPTPSSSSSPSPSSSSPSPSPPPPPPPPPPSPFPLPSPSPPSSSSPVIRKNCVEEFLESLSKNLTFYRVFPQDEKEAAILLMALSCGYAHEM